MADGNGVMNGNRGPWWVQLMQTVGPTAAIIQVGACTFELDGPAPAPGGFERTVALQSSLFAGGSIDISTIEWWRSRDHAAVERNAERLQAVLGDFITWFPASNFLWANGANFDPPVLESAFRSVGLTAPWKYNLVRDTRTLWHFAAELAGWEKPKRVVGHTALADARDVQSAWRALKEKCGGEYWGSAGAQVDGQRP